MSEPILSRVRLASRTTVREILVVVLSILIAFGLDAWWDGVRERSDSLTQLAAVHDEIEAAGAVIHLAIELRSAMVDRVVGARALLDVADSGAEVVLPDSLVGPLMPPLVLEIPTSVTEAFLGSGGVQNLDDAALEIALQGWPSRVEDLRDDQIHERDYQHREMVPFLRANFDVAAAQDRALLWLRPPGARPEIAETSVVNVELRRTPTLMNLLSTREFLERALVRDFRALEEERQALAELIRDRLPN